MISNDIIIKALLFGRAQLLTTLHEPPQPHVILRAGKDCCQDEESFRIRTRYGILSLSLSGNAVSSISFAVPTTASDHSASHHTATTHTTIDPKVRNLVEAIESASGFSNVSLLLCGTGFQQLVWQALLHIPRGGLVTYTDVAKAIGAPHSIRAVANAVAANRLAIAVPCHRVVPAAGGLGNYRWGADLKERLIADELLP